MKVTLFEMMESIVEGYCACAGSSWLDYNAEERAWETGSLRGSDVQVISEVEAAELILAALETDDD